MGVNRGLSLFAGVALFCGIVWGAQQASATRQAGPAPQATTNTTNTTNQTARGKVSGVVTSASSGQPVRKAQVTLMPVNPGNQGQGNQGNRGGGFQGQQNQGNQPGQANTPQGQQTQPGQQQRGQQGQNPNTQNQRGGGGGNNARSVTTGDDGTFSFSDVVPGNYRIRVDRDGFLTQEYGQRSWTGSGVPVTVQAGQALSGIIVQLVQGGTIAGRILDENLEPVTGIQVQALSYIYQNGERTLVSERQVQTNDLGEYRLYWLTPGDHYVTAIPNSRRGGLVQAIQQGFQRGGGGRGGGGNLPPLPGEDGQQEESYAATYYPGGIDPETAAPVRVGAATEVRGIDFILRPVLTTKVSGRVIGMDIPPTAQQLQQQAQQQSQQNQQQNRGGGGRGGNNNNNNDGGRGGRGGRGPFGGNMQVLLTRIGTNVSGGRGGGGGRGGRGGRADFIDSLAPVNQDGTFEINNVIPGSYNLTAIQQAQNQIYSTRARLEVGPGGVQGISLAVRPGAEVPGQIYLEGSPPANFQMDRLRVSLNPLDDLPIGNSNAQVDTAGKFTLTSVPAMSYRINLQGLPAGAYLIAGRFGSSDALGDPLQVDQSAPLSLQIGFAPGQVAVTVHDAASQPFAGAITVLIPSARGRRDLYKTATSDQSGQVIFTNVAPGDYKVIAWEDVPQGAYLNADFVQPYEDRAQSVHVDRSSSVSAQLKVIPRNEQ
jgi:hypothetical protein